MSLPRPEPRGIGTISPRPTLHDPHQRSEGLRHLRAADPALGAWIDHFGDVWSPRRRSYFAVLCHTIVNQQISVAAGHTIGLRLRTACGGRITPLALSRLDEGRLAACGLSRQKRAALRDLTAHVQDGRLRPDRLWRHDDEAVIEAITAVHGLGRWSAEMFLLFALGRPDVLSTGDLGLRHGAARLLGRPGPVEAHVLTARAESWRPWRSLGSLFLWAALDAPPEDAPA